MLSLITLFKFENGFDFRISNSKKGFKIIDDGALELNGGARELSEYQFANPAKLPRTR